MCPNAGDDLRAELHESRRHGDLDDRAHALRAAIGELHPPRDRAHVVAEEERAFHTERIEHSLDVVELRLGAEARIVGLGPPGATQIRADHAVTVRGDRGCDLPPLPPVHREAVHCHHGLPLTDRRDVGAQPCGLDDRVLEAVRVGKRRRPSATDGSF